jgi:tRNA-dihydrouridine synthase B
VIEVGAIRRRNPIALALMSELSDVPLRTIAWSQGAGYVVSEMVSSKPELWCTEKSARWRESVPGVRAIAIQLAGSAPTQLADCAQKHIEEGAQVIGLNFQE